MDEQRTKRYNHYKYQIKNNKSYDTKLRELSFSEKMKLKQNVDEDNQIDCIIRDVEKKNNKFVLTVSPSCCKNLRKQVHLSCNFHLNKDSEYEEFLKNNGISPIQENIRDDLLQKKVTLYLYVEDQSISLKHTQIKNVQTNENKRSDNPTIYHGSNNSPFNVDKDNIEPSNTEFKDVVATGFTIFSLFLIAHLIITLVNVLSLNVLVILSALIVVSAASSK